MTNLAKVEARDGYRIHVVYDDGAMGEVDLSHLAGRGVFAAWDEPGRFKHVRIGDAGSIRWGGDVEMCPDAVYLLLTGIEPEEYLDAISHAANA